MRDRVTQLKLNDKYNGMRLYDEVEEEERVIVNVDWVNRKGYQVVTQLVGFEGDTDQNQGYLINSELPSLIKAGKNPGYQMLMSEAEDAAWRSGAAATGDHRDDEFAEAFRGATAENLPMRVGCWP